MRPLTPARAGTAPGRAAPLRHCCHWADWCHWERDRAGHGQQPAPETALECKGRRKTGQDCAWSDQSHTPHGGMREKREKIKTRDTETFGEAGRRIWWEARLKVKGVEETGGTSKKRCKQHTQKPSQ